MKNQLFVFIGFGLAGVFGIMAFMAQRQVATLRALMIDAAKRFEFGKKTLEKLEADLKDAREKLDQDKINTSKLNTTLDEARAKYAAQTRDMILLKSQFEGDKRKQMTQLEHLQEQVKALTAQLAEADAARADAVALANKRVDEEQKRSRHNAAEANLKRAQDELMTARQLIKSQQQELERAKIVLTKLDPVEFKKLRQRVTSLEQIFLSMRGLKEMAEERADNWEIALRKLAAHVVGDKSKETSPIGPLVGAALEMIGDELLRQDPKDEEQALHNVMNSPLPTAIELNS